LYKLNVGALAVVAEVVKTQFPLAVQVAVAVVRILPESLLPLG
jgi:hypothetical protein